MKDAERYFELERNYTVPKLEVVEVAPNGLDYGEGSISYEDRKDEVGPEILARVDEVISSPEILVAVSQDKNGNTIDDDGCGDGRNWARIVEGAQERFKSLHRPKVFGGGATMAVSTFIGLGRAKAKSLRENFSGAMSRLHDRMIDYGAHTDTTHAHGPNCGCGAIDKAPVIVGNAVKFQKEIRGSIEALGIDTTGLDEVEAEYVAYANEIEDQDYAGAEVMQEIADNGKVIKELDDNHKEMLVLLNMVDGYTVDQEKVREVSGGQVQVFAVDVWRVKQLAERLYADESESVRHKAFLSQLVYTLATAATLTKGDLPVRIVNQQFAQVA
jgi:hypothetical protein